MAYIYKITNLISGKSYIGKTLSTIDERWREHCSDSKKRKNEIWRENNDFFIFLFMIVDLIVNHV